MSLRKIKKYANRRLYDTVASVYVKSSDLRDLLLAGEQLCVVDVQTGRDITRSVLLGILAEDAFNESHAPIFSEVLLTEAVRFEDNFLAGVLARFLEKTMQVFVGHRATFQAQMQDFDAEDPFAMIERLTVIQEAVLQEVAQGLANKSEE